MTDLVSASPDYSDIHGDIVALLKSARRAAARSVNGLRIGDHRFGVALPFFHRRLKYLLVIDLQVGKFSYTGAAQMRLYYARQQWTKPGKTPQGGFILCTEKGASKVHYALEGLPAKTRLELESRYFGQASDMERAK